MTFDGTQQFTFDGWNRLVSVAHAYRNGSGTLSSGQASVTMSYDGKGRRVKKTVTNSGQWDATFKYYYDGDSLVEQRNGSDQTLKQHVWGTRYIDELVQVSTNDDPTDGGEQTCETSYWACQDANYNVLGVVNSSAVLKERYEYKPYGERFVFFNPGSNDVGLYAPTQASRRVSVSSVDQPYGLCEVGHQGLVHDEEVGLVYNRARQLHTTIGRFVQRDRAQYADSLNCYESWRSGPMTHVDPRGTWIYNWTGVECCRIWGCVVVFGVPVQGLIFQECWDVTLGSDTLLPNFLSAASNTSGDQCCRPAVVAAGGYNSCLRAALHGLLVPLDPNVYIGVW
jgi:RHS repeat-associated protein